MNTELKCIALIAHDQRKDDMVKWVSAHIGELAEAQIFATGTTGGRIAAAHPELDLTCLKSGPLGGDQQIGAMIAEGRIDALIFFIDAMSALPHDVDVKALTRLAVLYNVPLACNASTADYIVQGF
jgi:methylglyoxal synthase